MTRKKAIIIGAGPAGLTAGYELLTKTDIQPLIFESEETCGGISKTISYKGNRIDVGGHRFFSTSQSILDWWLQILPLQDFHLDGSSYSYFEKKLLGMAAQKNPRSGPPLTDDVMLLRDRFSRIFFSGKFFSYPLSLSLGEVRNLGWGQVGMLGASYMGARAFPIRPEKNLEDFFINQFGRRFYRLFFKEYTRKVWGVPCNQIDSEWGVQRIKGLSLFKVLTHSLRDLMNLGHGALRSQETSLIKQFLYPKYGPGQLWERVAKLIVDSGGLIFYRHRIVGLQAKEDRIVAVNVRDEQTGQTMEMEGDYFISSMPVSDLIESLASQVPAEIQAIARGLPYVDSIIVGMLYRELLTKGENRQGSPTGLIPDNWIYIQDPKVRVSRVQIYNNWSPSMVADSGKVWLGVEFSCREGDKFWNDHDANIKKLAVEELNKLGIGGASDFLDGTVIRMRKTYPGYFASYNKFTQIRAYTDRFSNLFLIGRNGMHRYNNQDHSMMTAMVAVENILKGQRDKSNIWQVNTDVSYQEDKLF